MSTRCPWQRGLHLYQPYLPRTDMAIGHTPDGDDSVCESFILLFASISSLHRGTATDMSLSNSIFQVIFQLVRQMIGLFEVCVGSVCIERIPIKVGEWDGTMT